MKKYKAIIWDWNGTLLNDIVFGLECINTMLEHRKLPLLDMSAYRSIFGFPVKDYYKKAGFDFCEEVWDEVALEYMRLYWEGMSKCGLFHDVKDVLSSFRNAGMRQFVLSAMEHQSLNRLVADHQIGVYFEDVQGIHDHFANGKEALAMELIEKTGLHSEEMVIIGDTLHDYDVARQCGVDSILVSRGHQSSSRLLDAGVPVLACLEDVCSLISRL